MSHIFAMFLRKQRQHSRETARSGVAAAELAVCLPVVVLLVLATIEACTMIFLKQSLTVAGYEGVRTALVKDASSDDVKAACEQVLNDRRVEGAVVTVSPPNVAALNPGDRVAVTVEAPCAPNSALPVMFYQDKNMQSTSTMMIEL
jgi:Flp pilus assembly protein TadG